MAGSNCIQQRALGASAKRGHRGLEQVPSPFRNLGLASQTIDASLTSETAGESTIDGEGRESYYVFRIVAN